MSLRDLQESVFFKKKNLFKRKSDRRGGTTLKKRIYPHLMIQSTALDRSCPPSPQYRHRLVANFLAASERMTSPGQAMIFQTVSEGDLPFTSAVAEDSSTPLSFVWGGGGGGGGRDWGQKQRQNIAGTYFTLNSEGRQMPEVGGLPSCDLWPGKPYSSKLMTFPFIQMKQKFIHSLVWCAGRTSV